MSITRRKAMVAMAGCGILTNPVAANDDKLAATKEQRRHDPVYMNLPVAHRSIFEKTFPDHLCIRMAIRGEKEAAVYRGTVFNPAAMGCTTRFINGESVSTPVLHHMELDARGKVLEETPHYFPPARLPKAVLAAYEKWNPKGVQGQYVSWTTEVPRGKDRVYHVGITMNSITSYLATYGEDGTVLKAEPAVVP